jgi:hypothetical protein
LQPLAVGAPGAGIGYSGIAESLAIEFDLWKDLDNNVRAIQYSCVFGQRVGYLLPVQDPDDNHISIHTNGAAGNSAEERSPFSGGTQIGLREKVGDPNNKMGNGKVPQPSAAYMERATALFCDTFFCDASVCQ